MKPFKPVEIVLVDSSLQINDQLLADRQEPVILRGCSIGPCLEKWSPEFLQSTGATKLVKVHRSKEPQLDFRNKNFTYETVRFSDLVKYCSEPSNQEAEDNLEYWYLRSLGEDPR